MSSFIFSIWIELACMQTISVKINVKWLRFSQVVWATMLRFISCKIILSCKTSQIGAWIRSLEYRSKFNNQLMVRRCYILCGCKHKNSNCQNKVVSMLYKCSHIVGYKILRLSFEGHTEYLSLIVSQFLRSFTILSKFWYITLFQATTLKICIVILPIKWWYLSCSTSMICLSMNRHVLWS